MTARGKYVKREHTAVVAIQLTLDTAGFTYRKWGSTQTCKQGDWIVNDGGEVHTVDQTSFANTYQQVGPGTYMKTMPVWAEIATTAGEVTTKEGVTHYKAGDYLVFNEEQGGDAYAVPAERFTDSYERVS